MKLKREEMLSLIEEASAFEEKAIPIYSNHLAAALDRSPFDAEKQAFIREKLTLLANESRGHVELLNLVRNIYLADKE